ncbi:MAG: hypothetical protein INR71_10420 [Terriglobus roseus]|nr:hypothetical protein [Terriglobus roseus]
MPGGQEAILLSRVALVDDSEPEFVSTTVLPGVGMQVLQTTVAVPDQNPRDLLVSVPLSDAARMPPESISSGPFHLRVSNRSLQEKGAGEDLIGTTPASDAQNQTLVDGGQATGTFTGTGSKAGVTATIEVTLSGRQIDLVARATNKSEESRFVAFEWNPRFAAPDGDLNQLGFSVPSQDTAGATGKQRSSGPGGQFLSATVRPVGNQPFDFTFSHLDHEFLSDGTYLQLQNGKRFLLRIIGLGDALRSVRARNDAATHSLLLNLSSLDTAPEAEQHDQTLRPGQTVQWHLRMEVLPVKPPLSTDSAH